MAPLAGDMTEPISFGGCKALHDHTLMVKEEISPYNLMYERWVSAERAGMRHVFLLFYLFTRSI